MGSVTKEELDNERRIWERDGIVLSDRTLKNIIIERREYDIWVGIGQKVSEVGD